MHRAIVHKRLQDQQKYGFPIKERQRSTFLPLHAYHLIRWCCRSKTLGGLLEPIKCGGPGDVGRTSFVLCLYIPKMSMFLTFLWSWFNAHAIKWPRLIWYSFWQSPHQHTAKQKLVWTMLEEVTHCDANPKKILKFLTAILRRPGRTKRSDFVGNFGGSGLCLVRRRCYNSGRRECCHTCLRVQDGSNGILRTAQKSVEPKHQGSKSVPQHLEQHGCPTKTNT